METKIQNTQTFTPELESHTRKLSEIANWFIDYGRKVRPSDDHITERLVELDNSLTNAAHMIAELVAIEFEHNVYHQ